MPTSSRLFICLISAALTLASAPPAFAELCGDSIPDPGEECDDGNLESGDGCSATCNLEQNLGLAQAACIIDAVNNSAGGLLQPGDQFVVNFPIPLLSNFLGSQPSSDGISGFFGSPNPNSFAYNFQGGGQAVGETTQSLLGLQDGTTDILAVGGFDSNAAFDDWAVTGFSAELADSTGTALDTVETWPGPDFDFSTFDLSQCGVDFQNTETLETARATGTVSQVQSPLPEKPEFQVLRGDWPALGNAIKTTNALPPGGKIPVIEFYGPDKPFVVTNLFGDDAALLILRNVELRGAAVFQRDILLDDFSFAVVAQGAHLHLNNNSGTKAQISGFAASFYAGGALTVAGSLAVENYLLSDNSSDSGGAINGTGATITLTGCTFYNNDVKFSGGALNLTDSDIFIDNTYFSFNKAGISGCDLSLNNTKLDIVTARNAGTVYGTSECGSSRVYDDSNRPITFSSTDVWEGVPASTFIETYGESPPGLLGSTFGPSPGGSNPNSINRLDISPDAFAKPEVVCEPGAPGSVVSLGYNIASDDSCNLDQPTDQPNTNPMMSEPDENGIRKPLPGSPAIDFGPSDLVMLEGDDVPSLPCGWRDILGLGRPQDGNGDGVFECDAGAVEVQGAGEIQAGHSGAFYNSLRNGEGEYVEILNDTTAVVYTFTFNPDGSGPAWFVSLANVVGNSLVSQTLTRPIGAGFGAAFDPDDIEFSNAGGMSMVFPACDTHPVPGNIAFSGEAALEYEPLITKAERITHVAGCGMSVTPHANAGLSGSFYDATRNGEGLIVQWLPDGTVLAIMFTFAPNGEQMWITGTGTSNGNSVTINALYPTGFTSWGSDFDAGQVQLSPWGTFTLTWTDCNSLTFQYASNLPAYGSATRNYSRLTSLAGLDCP